jgi:hypothetical protein
MRLHYTIQYKHAVLQIPFILVEIKQISYRITCVTVLFKIIHYLEEKVLEAFLLFTPSSHILR